MGKKARSWYVDETSIKVHEKWCYLYRAIDHDGNLVDSRLSEKRDMHTAQRFFKQALAAVGHAPESVTTDGHRSYDELRNYFRSHSPKKTQCPLLNNGRSSVSETWFYENWWWSFYSFVDGF